ncbi:hypothetical protein [Streptomyces sp. PTD5-9]|uniref:hypothetical protein n=1 Tax=Streptomyces sp. PTD5-9 TaxID=3120150 RepID=UPI003007FA96
MHRLSTGKNEASRRRIRRRTGERPRSAAGRPSGSHRSAARGATGARRGESRGGSPRGGPGRSPWGAPNAAAPSSSSARTATATGIPGLRGPRPAETNFWWWRTPGGDNGVRRAAHGHEAWDHLTERAVRRHYHGLLEPPAGATVLACAELEQEGDRATRQVLLHEDRVSTPGRLIVTTMDPVYHPGSRFMPGAAQLLLGLLRRTGTTAPARPE